MLQYDAGPVHGVDNYHLGWIPIREPVELAIPHAILFKDQPNELCVYQLVDSVLLAGYVAPRYDAPSPSMQSH